jgi:hypothetical protein
LSSSWSEGVPAEGAWHPADRHFQEARNLIAKSLPNSRCSDMLEFQRFAAGSGTASWEFDEVEKLLVAAMGEVSRTKAVYQRELADFAAAVGDGILHGSGVVFDFLEALDLDDDSLKYNDKLILSSVLVRGSRVEGCRCRSRLLRLDR